MGPEQSPINKEPTAEEEPFNFVVGQRVSFTEGEGMMGLGKPVEKFGTITDIKQHTAGVRLEEDANESSSMVVRVAKNEIKDASV